MTESPIILLDRPLAEVDALTEILSAVRLCTAHYCGAELDAPWAITFEARQNAVFHVVHRGSCYLSVPGAEGAPIWPMQSGDLVLLPHGDEHTLADQPRLRGRVVSFEEEPGCRIRTGGGGLFAQIVCAEVELEGVEVRPLLAQLPRVLRLSSEGESALALTCRLLGVEAISDRPGRHALVRRTAELLVLQTLRAWLCAGEPAAPGWLRGLKDPRIARALGCIHALPAEPWTVARLARQAGMGRSAFTERFQHLVGEPPATYLASTRIRRAAELLVREPQTPVAAVGRAVGYDSEAAFSRAFKRLMGRAPRHWRVEAARVVAKER